MQTPAAPPAYLLAKMDPDDLINTVEHHLEQGFHQLHVFGRTTAFSGSWSEINNQVNIFFLSVELLN